jgi:hypothetical protein
MKQQQEQDPDLTPIIQWLQGDGDPLESDIWLQSAATKEIWLNKSQVEFSEEGLLLYRWEGKTGINTRVWWCLDQRCRRFWL